ncbi:type III PLP-dependent enzyme [Psychrobacter sp. TAE2020]|uniref:type III PLP-dependent enzyme n=1 Tax=Psychrobacter sp. TAE2020 TaxID=2846762 RepID=UPI001C10715D|nr:type III PLP-dependent enzyme [Psychrobacter sp. TAE2020]MBU5617089.1 type III PLP-dependent enzyme [Psychrobacter sp. TAE2020]
MIKIDRYFDPASWQKFTKAAEGRETPFLVVDLSRIKTKYNEMIGLFPQAKIHYAMKASPAVEVINLLADLGSNFDCASVYELDRVLNCDVDASRISYGNTIKKAKDVKYSYEKGVRLYATDSEADLKNIAEHAPGSKIFVRILVQGSDTAEWPLSRKFGCHPDMAIDLLIQARDLGLVPYGISFHVGSQQKDVAAWDDALAKVKYMFDWMINEEGIKLQMINLGGGFPANYLSEVNPIQVYAQEVKRYLTDDYNEQDMPEIILEPGRSLVGGSGVLVSDVILISRKSHTDLVRWVYTDVGLFQGLIETLGEAIKYPLYTPKMETSTNAGTVVLAGPTCDSADIMYEETGYQLPQELEIGDKIYWLTTGAYTNSYSSIEFNGFPPLEVVYVD